MVGLGMIFEDTYLPFFESVRSQSLYSPSFGVVRPVIQAVASRTGGRVSKYLNHPLWKDFGIKTQSDFVANSNIFKLDPPKSITGPESGQQIALEDLDVVCVATPDHLHFEPALAALQNQKHLIIEKPSVLSLQELDTLVQTAKEKGVLAKVVYHKLLDPDHKKLRTHVAEGNLKHVNSGYCTLLEPRQISGSQFSQWISGRNPATYVAVHYLKLIDFTFGSHWKLTRISATGQRGIVDMPSSSTWDSVQLRVVYTHTDSREAAFDIHTSWVNPDNFPGYVDQEVQFRFDNGIWSAHQRKRGVELAIEGRTPNEIKETPNNHYSTEFLEPWGERSRRGYGIEAIEQIFREIAFVEFGGDANEREQRLQSMRNLSYNDLSADRNCVAIVQGLEAILKSHAEGNPECIVEVNGSKGGLVLYSRKGDSEILYSGSV